MTYKSCKHGTFLGKGCEICNPPTSGNSGVGAYTLIGKVLKPTAPVKTKFITGYFGHRVLKPAIAVRS